MAQSDCAAHAVPDQKDRQIGMCLSGAFNERVQVSDQPCEAPDAATPTARATVTAVVDGVDRVVSGIQARRHVLITAAVFGGPMDDDHSRDRRLIREPGLALDADVADSAEFEWLALHG
jgi:hypothetical protein